MPTLRYRIARRSDVIRSFFVSGLGAFGPCLMRQLDGTFGSWPAIGGALEIDPHNVMRIEIGI